MSRHTVFAYGNASKPWWERETVLGLTKNHLIFATLAFIIGAVFFRLNWDQIVTMW